MECPKNRRRERKVRRRVRSFSWTLHEQSRDGEEAYEEVAWPRMKKQKMEQHIHDTSPLQPQISKAVKILGCKKWP